MYEELIEYAKRIGRKVDSYIYNIVRGKPQVLYEASTHLIKAGGKRLRPLLTVLSCRVVGGNEELAIPAGAAVEILHNFTLIHDDIMDKDEMRRGKPTVHKLWGVEMAILAGDLLYAKAYQALLGLYKLGVSSERVTRAIELLTWGSVSVAEGQALDMEFEKRDDVSEEEYLEMIKKKTAALFMASAGIGGIVGGGDDNSIRALMEYARYMGIAFQIRDDILGLIGDEKVLGKPVLSDIREGKRTILVIYTLPKLNEKERLKLLSVLGNRQASLDELREAAELIRSTGAIEYADKLAEKYIDESLKALNKVDIKDTEALRLLKLLNNFVTRRRY
mgnify:CR=1 FL=1